MSWLRLLASLVSSLASAQGQAAREARGPAVARDRDPRRDGRGTSRPEPTPESDGPISKLTAQQIAAATGAAADLAERWRPHLVAAMERFDICTPARIAAFLAQISHESGRLARLEENLMYSAQRLRQVFPRHFASDAEVEAYARKPEAIASRVYANRIGNGSEASGDGWRFRGRGLIQITGRANYEECGAALGLPLIQRPELLAEPAGAALSAAWYWSSRGCNELADAGDMTKITRVINGGTWGLEERLALYESAKDALHLA